MRTSSLLLLTLCTTAFAQVPAPATPDAPAPSPAQTSQPGQSTRSTQTAPANPVVPTPSSKSAAQRFPFPGATAVPDMPRVQDEVPYVPEGQTPAAPNRGGVPAKPQPGQSSSQSEAPRPGGTPEPSSSSSSSSAGDVDPAADTENGGLKDEGTSGQIKGRHKLAKVQVQSDEDRAAEDLKVAEFYRSRGSLRAAYLRAQDAVTVLPEDPEGHFVLARICEESKKPDQAAAQYKEYLRLEPDGDKAKAAKLALQELAQNP